RDACLAAGMCAHLSKPFELDQLVAAILKHTPAAPRSSRHPQPPEPGSWPFAERNPGVVNWPALEALFKGQPQFVDQIAHKALSTYRNELAELREFAGGAGTLAALAFLAHDIKDSAGALQAPGIQQLAAGVDATARAGHNDARVLAGTLANHLEALLEELEMRVGADSTEPHDFIG
ncbi:Hpt domain-containing protein, partial [Zoogloea sp.]|uniref:Hpt domain-containing protein n=1 Tax=Zoogloea sp. TaxID=49181 RepID=UPI0026218BC9